MAGTPSTCGIPAAFNVAGMPSFFHCDRPLPESGGADGDVPKYGALWTAAGVSLLIGLKAFLVAAAPFVENTEVEPPRTAIVTNGEGKAIGSERFVVVLGAHHAQAVGHVELEVAPHVGVLALTRRKALKAALADARGKVRRALHERRLVRWAQLGHADQCGCQGDYHVGIGLEARRNELGPPQRLCECRRIGEQLAEGERNFAVRAQQVPMWGEQAEAGFRLRRLRTFEGGAQDFAHRGRTCHGARFSGHPALKPRSRSHLARTHLGYVP
jgi:hypothetical protein